MSFGRVFDGAWKDYWGNFGSIVQFFGLFYVLPVFVAGLILGLIFGPNPQDLAIGEAFWFFLVSIFMGIIVFLFSLFVTGSLVAVKKRKFKFENLMSDFKGKYLNFVGFAIVLYFFIILLYLALIIPGIIFTVFWVFGIFIFVIEKKGVIESLKVSFRMVRGRWWRVFGNVFLLMIFLILLTLMFSGLFWVTFALMPEGPLKIIVNNLIEVIPTFFTVPFGILFLKNFYFALKKEGNVKKKKK